MRLSADHRGQLGLDQRLIDRGRCRPDPLINLRSLQHFKQLKQGRLIQSHRVMCPFARTIGVVSLTITRWPSPTWSPTPTRPTTYTTSWDITSLRAPRQQPTPITTPVVQAWRVRVVPVYPELRPRSCTVFLHQSSRRVASTSATSHPSMTGALKPAWPEGRLTRLSVTPEFPR